MSSSSERNVVDKRWAHHYAEASRRRRQRGWHRREDGKTRPGTPRWHVYAVVGVFAALVVAALMISK